MKEIFEREKVAFNIYKWMKEGFPDPTFYFTDSPSRFVAQLIIEARSRK